MLELIVVTFTHVIYNFSLKVVVLCNADVEATVDQIQKQIKKFFLKECFSEIKKGFNVRDSIDKEHLNVIYQHVFPILSNNIMLSSIT